jgi:hypothetical protein
MFLSLLLIIGHPINLNSGYCISNIGQPILIEGVQKMKISINKKNRNWNKLQRPYENPFLNAFVYRSFN